MDERLVLVSIAPSNYVEKARWALQLAKTPFVEEAHVPVFHRFRTKPLGGTSVPLLYLPERKTALRSSSEILAFCSKTVPSLYDLPEAKELEDRYDNDFGPHTRRIAYFFAFKDWTLARWLLVGPVTSRFERVVGTTLLPLLKQFLFQFMDVNEKEVRNSLDRVDKIVADANQRLGDGPIGSKFLAGESFSAADLTFCAHMSLLVGPPEHIFMRPLPALGDPALHARIKSIQESKAGQFALWCYKNKRPPMRG